MNAFDGDSLFRGNLEVRGNITGSVLRENITKDSQAEHPINLQDFRVWNAFQTPLGTAASDDLGITAGAFGTGNPYIISVDMNAAGAVTGYARCMFQVPVNYVAASTVKVNLSTGMLTAVASVSATVDVEVYKFGRDTLVTGSDLVTTAATSMNSLTFSDKSFTLTSTAISPGDILDIRIAIIANSATASSHFAAIAAVEVLLDVKG